MLARRDEGACRGYSTEEQRRGGMSCPTLFAPFCGRPAFGPSTFDDDERSHPSMGLTCPNCGNERSFLAKTLQVHVVQAGGNMIAGAFAFF